MGFHKKTVIWKHYTNIFSNCTNERVIFYNLIVLIKKVVFVLLVCFCMGMRMVGNVQNVK